MQDFMLIAVSEAKKAMSEGNVPVGAVLVIDGVLVGVSHNHNNTDKTYNAHAESTLIAKCATAIRAAADQGKTILLYTTWEPCIMCFGASVLNRITKIVYACPEPWGGTSHLSPTVINKKYAGHWPKVERGLYCIESYSLLYEFMKDNPS